MKIFICTDDEQNISAKVSKSLIEKIQTYHQKIYALLTKKISLSLIQSKVKNIYVMENGRP